MSDFRRRVLLNSFKMVDLVILVFAFGVATVVVQSGTTLSIEQFLAMRITITNFILFLGLMLCWHSLFTFLGLYFSMRLSSRWTEIIEILKATFFGTVIIYIVASLFKMVMITPLFLIAFWVVSSFMTILCRYLLRIILGRVRGKGRNLRNILVVGTNEWALQFAETITRKTHLGYLLVGFVDTLWVDKNGSQFKDSYPLVNPENLADFLKENVVDEVMICLPIKEYYDQHASIIDRCVEQGVIVRILADQFFSQLAHARIEYFEGSSILTLYTGAMEGLPLFLKRIFDILIASALLIILSPLLVLVAIFIKCSSPGPVFFVQERLGLNKRRFRLYKFRTMVQDAEKMQKELEEFNEADGPVFKIKNDPRITKEGRFLRVTSIDEFPQLLNVIKGDMSLVGPRPLPVRDYEGFDQRWFNRRFSVRPGMTCIWQIDGRSDISFEKWIQLDLRYIDTWSLPLDFQILLRTIPAVIKGRGAS